MRSFLISLLMVLSFNNASANQSIEEFGNEYFTEVCKRFIACADDTGVAEMASMARIKDVKSCVTAMTKRDNPQKWREVLDLKQVTFDPKTKEACFAGIAKMSCKSMAFGVRKPAGIKGCESVITGVVADFKSDSYIIDNKDSKLYISTNLNAPNKRIITVDANNPNPKNWKDLIPETKNVLSVSTGSGYIFAKYMVDAISKVKQYDYDGKLIREIKLPGIGTASGFGGEKEDKTLYFNFSNYTTPSSIYQLDPKTGVSTLYKKSKVDFDSDKYESKQVFYTSKDGTKIPMIITYKKGLDLNGKNPTILYGYGGFNISITPSFSIANTVWLANGGVYAVANLRGGGEYGRAWHDAGTKLKKQNVFDDFIAAAEYLIAKNYTSSNYLAIRGGSNGGLLVGAVMTQRPDLMKVALPAVGVLDMLRYHTFTAGAGWAYDYGTANDNKEMFDYLKNYSPVHNVKENTCYPATLITTGDHDDRVVPAHSFKFAAQLQTKQACNNPVLIRIETNAGHGAGTPTSKTIQQYADIYAFTLFNMKD